ncbi:UNVERIFIED_CONTAM: hypothetical protein Sradi_6006500 [Sesamum radiatum]|uniref:Uncharacterized protein n=1 Tax=Sesamum radiatum TaxID=300843 RepID=A0AAW2KHG8_SESRA
MTMTENPKLEEMGFDHNLMCSNGESEELGEGGTGLKICVSDHVNGLQHHSSAAKSDSFVVDMERFSHLTEKDMNANSRITFVVWGMKKLQRNLSRKVSARSGEKKIIATNERDTTLLATSPRGGLSIGLLHAKYGPDPL